MILDIPTGFKGSRGKSTRLQGGCSRCKSIDATQSSDGGLNFVLEIQIILGRRSDRHSDIVHRAVKSQVEHLIHRHIANSLGESEDVIHKDFQKR